LSRTSDGSRRSNINDNTRGFFEKNTRNIHTTGSTNINRKSHEFQNQKLSSQNNLSKVQRERRVADVYGTNNANSTSLNYNTPDNVGAEIGVNSRNTMTKPKTSDSNLSTRNNLRFTHPMLNRSMSNSTNSKRLKTRSGNQPINGHTVLAVPETQINSTHPLPGSKITIPRQASHSHHHYHVFMKNDEPGRPKTVPMNLLI